MLNFPTTIVRPSSTGGEGGGADARPGWLEELSKARETKLLRLPHELRRLEWGPEDDAKVDELIVGGQAAEASALFEERKATAVPVYRQTLRYHWTQTGRWAWACVGVCWGYVCGCTYA